MQAVQLVYSLEDDHYYIYIGESYYGDVPDHLDAIDLFNAAVVELQRNPNYKYIPQLIQ